MTDRLPDLATEKGRRNEKERRQRYGMRGDITRHSPINSKSILVFLQQSLTAARPNLPYPLVPNILHFLLLFLPAFSSPPPSPGFCLF